MPRPASSGRVSPVLILLPATVALVVLVAAGFWPDRNLLVVAVAANAAALAVAVALALRQTRRPAGDPGTLPAGVARAQADARHQATLRSIGDAVIVTDQVGRVELLNPVAERLTGWSQEEALGRPLPEVFRIINETTREPGENPVARVLQEGVTVGLANHTLLIAKNGVECPIADSASPIGDHQGKILGVVLVFRDQTKERDAQRALEENHALLQAVVEGSADPIMVKDRDGRYLLLNSAAARLTGKSIAEALGQDDHFLFPPERATRIIAEDRAILASGTPVQRDESITGADGRLHHFSLHKGPVRGPDGSATGVWCVAHDVTARKLGELALRDEQQRMRLAVETTHVGIWEWNLKNNLIRWDHEMFRIYGLPPTADGFVNYADWQAAVFPDEILQQEAIMQETIARKGKSSRAFRIRRALDGTTRHLETFETVRLSETGEAEWMVGTNLDVTQRKQAEDKLLKEKVRLASIIFAADVGTWEWNVPTGEVTFNERWAGILGYTLPELEPVSIDTWLRLAHPEDLKVSGDLLNRHFRRELPYYECEARMRHKLGHWVWVLDRGQVVTWGEDGKPLVMQGTHTDITERKAAESQRRHMQRMESIGTLAGGIAHDLNNILSPILIVPEMLKRRTTDTKDQELLEMIQQSARRGSEIIRQLLTFSRRVEGEFVLVQPRHLLRDIMSIMRETFPRELELDITVPATLPLIKADPTQMHQVLLNLCLNARDAMPEGGRLRLNAAERALAAGDPELPPGIEAGPFILIEVSDTGHGIPAEIRDRIFDPFFTTKPIGKGTGLGLSTVQGILNGHGGFITVESSAGHGATFRVHLPVAATVETDTAGQTVAAPLAGGGATILVVDDEVSIRRSFALGLEAHGYRVLTAAHGGEGLEVFRQNQSRISAVLTDLMMPAVNGVAFAKALRAISPHLPVIAASGLAEARYAEELGAIGVNRILAKPCTMETILQAVSEVLAEARKG